MKLYTEYKVVHVIEMRINQLLELWPLKMRPVKRHAMSWHTIIRDGDLVL